MADDNGTAGAPEGGLEDFDIDALLDAEISMADRVPVAAVTRRVKLGDHQNDDVVVICNDGAAYVYLPNAQEWKEIEPVPGTPRAVERSTN